MFKSLSIFFRGQIAAVAEQAGQSARLPLLDQQTRDCAESLGRAQKAIALAMAQERAETRRLAALDGRIDDLESRALQALKAQRDDIALQAAACIADLEADRVATAAARDTAAHEIALLRESFEKARARLGELDRGRKLARARESLGRIGQDLLRPDAFLAGLNEAEYTLQKLREEQELARDAGAAWNELDAERRPDQIIEKLAALGCGPRLRETPDDVLARLKAQM